MSKPEDPRIRVGLFLGARVDAIAKQRQVWQLADDAGFDHLWHDDHLLSQAGGNPPDLPILEAWTLLGAKAEATRRVRIGILVTANLLRNPGMLAKMGTTVDHLSGGRLEMAMGTGHAELEFSSLGMPFAGLPDRIEMLDEACTVLKLLWTQRRSDHDGAYYRLVDAISEPKPVQQPHPPIWIGGRGPKRTLRVTARHADVWNTSGSKGFDADVEASRILDEHCLAIGRDPAEIRRSTMVQSTSVDEVCRWAERYAAAGFGDIILSVPEDEPRRPVEDVAIPAMRRIRELVVAPVA
jgi:alkanesulfonate monooxygenase SsuD/methylene tetrahydromethanopterin reductase-like flavin-dependent oxidoreductase (luciferase family)